MEVTIGWVSVWSTDFNFHNLGQEATKSDLSTPQQIDLTIINPKIFLKMVLLIHHTFHSLVEISQWLLIERQKKLQEDKDNFFTLSFCS